jgi:hypothetical protein
MAPPKIWLGGLFLDMEGHLKFFQSSLQERGSSSLLRAQRAGICLTSFGRRRAKTARLLKIDFDSVGLKQFAIVRNVISRLANSQNFRPARYSALWVKNADFALFDSKGCGSAHLKNHRVHIPKTGGKAASIRQNGCKWPHFLKNRRISQNVLHNNAFSSGKTLRTHK